jgi:hypothetical protein
MAAAVYGGCVSWCAVPMHAGMREWPGEGLDLDRACMHAMFMAFVHVKQYHRKVAGGSASRGFEPLSS